MCTKRDFQRIEAKHDALVEAYAYVKNELGVTDSALERQYLMSRMTLRRLRLGSRIPNSVDEYFVRFIRVMRHREALLQQKGLPIAEIREVQLRLLLMYLGV